MERVRPGQRETAPQQVASHAPRERAFARTLVGGVTIQEAIAAAALTVDTSALAENDQGAGASWPPMPSVPNELEGSLTGADSPTEPPEADVPTGVRLSGSVAPARMPSVAPERKMSSRPPAVPAGGAIWQAMPSLVDTPVAIEITSRESAAPRSTPPAAKTPNGRPAVFRPSAAELEAEHSHSYGDQRVLKYEKMVERNAWDQLAEALGQERDLSPALVLLRIIAEREMLKGDQKQEAALLAHEGISAMAKILNLPEASPTALVLGKRLLRRNPGWAPKRAASTGLSISLLLGGIGIGGAIGWLITSVLF